MVKDYYDIRLENFSDYLIINGWIENKDFPNKKIKLFLKDDLSIVLPAKKLNYADYNLTIERALNLLSTLEERDTHYIIQDINSIFKDSFKIRIQDTTTQDGSIPIDNLKTFIDGFTNFIKYTIATEKNPVPYFKQKPKTAAGELNKFKFGQTEFGSFVINIEVNHSDFFRSVENQISLFSASKPFERKVMERIYFSMNQILKAVLKDSIDNIINGGYLKGLNGNMCDALLNALDNKNFNNEYQYIPKFSPLFETDEKIKSKKLILPAAIKEVLKEVRNEFKKNPYETKQISITAKPVALNTYEYTADKTNKIIFRPIEENNIGNIKNIYAILSDCEYANACDLMKLNKKILIKGTIEKNKNNWTLKEHEPFTVIDD